VGRTRLTQFPAHAIEGDREQLLTASSAHAYLEKPIYDPNILINKIKAMMGQ
jgi:CheY-like chemotaxis protein